MVLLLLAGCSSGGPPDAAEPDAPLRALVDPRAVNGTVPFTVEFRIWREPNVYADWNLTEIDPEGQPPGIYLTAGGNFYPRTGNATVTISYTYPGERTYSLHVQDSRGQGDDLLIRVTAHATLEVNETVSAGCPVCTTMATANPTLGGRHACLEGPAPNCRSYPLDASWQGYAYEAASLSDLDMEFTTDCGPAFSSVEVQAHNGAERGTVPAGALCVTFWVKDPNGGALDAMIWQRV